MTDENKTSPENSISSSPGALALAVAQQMDEVVFKKPLPVSTVTKKTFKAEVLEEETYLEEIGKIIQRDFFPDLEKLKAQQDYLSAVENNDVLKLREIYAKYGIVRRMSTDNVCASPATFETPVMRTIESADSSAEPASHEGVSSEFDIDEPVRKQRKVKSLDEFLKCYTSEDNQSFEDIVIENEMKQRAKQPWLYKDETSQKSNLALTSIQEQLMITDRPANVDTWSYKNRNYIMYVPDGVEHSKEEKLNLIKKHREIKYANTRLQDCPFDEEQNKEALQSLALLQVRTLDGKIGIDGKELALLDADKVNGYGYVKTPSPMPGVNESPLMTWGQIDGTPFRLDGSDTPMRPGLPGPVFKIAEPPARERLAHALAEKVGEKNKDSKKKALETAKMHLASTTPRLASPFERFDSVSPAAHKLQSHYLKSRNTDGSLRSPRTPRTPLLSPKISSKSKNTPLRVSECTPTRSTANVNLTDNLLNLKVAKRPKAADFFS